MPSTNSAEMRPGGAQLLLPPRFPLTGALKPLTVACQTPALPSSGSHLPSPRGWGLICDPQAPVLVPQFDEKEGPEEEATVRVRTQVRPLSLSVQMKPRAGLCPSAHGGKGGGLMPSSWPWS